MSFFSNLASDIKTNPYAGKDPGNMPIPPGRYTVLINKADEEAYLWGAWKEADFIAAKIADPSLVPGKQLSLEFEIVEGPHQGRKIWDRLVFQRASNHPDFKNFTAEQCEAKGVRSIQGLFKRAAVPPELIDKDGADSLLNCRLVLPVGVRTGKDGVARNETHLTIGKDEDITAVGPVNTARPQTTDEPPF